MHNGQIDEALLDDGSLDGYQAAATSTAVYPGKGTFWGLCYVTLKGAGEAGEFAEKVGKILRDDGVSHDTPVSAIDKGKREAMILEIGDELWYIAAKCNELGVSLEDVARANIKKLVSRQKRGKLAGSGDYR